MTLLYESLLIALQEFEGEEELVAKITYDAMTGVTKDFEELYNVKWVVQLEVDVEVGKNWLDMDSFTLDYQQAM